jgi:type IV secretion system protein VirB10
MHIDHFEMGTGVTATIDASQKWAGRLRFLLLGLMAVALMNINVIAQKKVVKRASSAAQTVTRLTGTYRLNAEVGDDIQRLAERATESLRDSERQRAMDELLSQLELADIMAIERRGKSISLVSSNAPRVTFLADGITRTERTSDGTSARVKAVLKGDQLVINYSGIQGNDSTVTFDLIDAASRLSVTRRVYGRGLTKPVIAQSLYDRTSDVAHWDIYGGSETTAGVSTTTTTQSGTFIVPDGTTLVAVLNDALSTKQNQDRDRFTLTVREPSKYAGAVLEGYVTNVKRSGKLTGRSEMTFNFERIRLANGRSYRFAGVVENLRTPDGEKISVDNEGAVKEGETRTSTTAKRAGVGTAVGAIIGAIAGGGKGAAIGAIIGGGAGAGSVYIQGRDDLELARGTEVNIRASAPK